MYFLLVYMFIYLYLFEVFSSYECMYCLYECMYLLLVYTHVCILVVVLFVYVNIPYSTCVRIFLNFNSCGYTYCHTRPYLTSQLYLRATSHLVRWATHPPYYPPTLNFFLRYEQRCTIVHWTWGL